MASSPTRNPEAAKRRLAFQKSYSQEHGTSWTRRSLIEDAKFETITNAEFKKQERLSTSAACDDLNEEDLLQGEAVDDAFPVTNGDTRHHVIGENASSEQRKCTVMLCLRDSTSLSRLFKHFENGHNCIQHVETRKSRKTGTALELLLTFETTRDNIVNVIKSVKALSNVQDVTILNDKQQTQKSTPWFPTHISDLDKCHHLLTKFDPDLDQSHPGFTDSAYIERRKTIAEHAFEYRHGDSIPYVEYSAEEVACWGTVYSTLRQLYVKHACTEYMETFLMLEREVGWCATAIPQLQDTSKFLQRQSGFRLRPVAGLLSARDFLASLAFRVFQCTQYVRHPSKPDHTVEPDCIHELLGHVPMLSNAKFAQFSQEIGLASLGASDKDIERFATIYWFTVEFGMCRQNGEIKMFGAAILSAYGEFLHALSDTPEKREFEPHSVAHQAYDDQDLQPIYYVCNTFEEMTEQVKMYAKTMKRPYEVRYDPYTQSIQVLDNRRIIQDISHLIKADLNILNNAIQRIDNLTIHGGGGGTE